jgi:hypothetical protein
VAAVGSGKVLLGVPAIGFGVAFIITGRVLTGVAGIGGGAAAIGFGLAFIGPAAVMHRIRHLLSLATKPPQACEDHVSVESNAGQP